MAFSYQHEYHAGNHADVLKHITISLILESLCKKDKPFTVIDSHCGAGRFNLSDERLLKTREAESGIKRLIQKNINNTAIEKYIHLQTPYYSKGLYAGSAELERLFLRKQDALHLIEKHPAVLQSLKENIKLPLETSDGEKKAEGSIFIHEEDSYKALKALTPPLIKRGLVLCAPSYEDAGDYKAVTETLSEVQKKWNTAIIALWYPLITRRKNETSKMLITLEDNAKMSLTPRESFKVELIIKNKDTMTEENKCHLYGSGMFIINPPWQLKENLTECINVLKENLSETL